MSASNFPFGLKPVRHINGKFVPPPRAIVNGIPSGLTQNIYIGSPVALTSTGVINVVSTTTGALYGVFAGCQFVTDNTSLMTPAAQWTSGAAYTGTSNMIAYVWEDPGIIYEIQSAGSLAQSIVGDQGALVNPTSGGNGASYATISSAAVGAGNSSQLSIRGLSNRIDNAWGDSFTVVEVQIAAYQFASQYNAV